jgi:imidazolonepropionase-like amidohydrolase
LSFLLGTLGALPVALAGPEIPGAPQNGPIVIVGATIHPVSGAPIKDAEILFEKGKIVALGKGLPLSEGVERIDATGKHVYPGLIDPFSDLGLVEIPAIRATRDDSESGEINANVKAQVAFNPDSELLPVARANGILTVLSVPSGGLISGQSALMHLDGWTWEDMTCCSPVAVHVNWPRMGTVRSFNVEQTEAQQVSQNERLMRQLDDAFAAARSYRAAKAAHAKAGTTAPAPDTDLRYEALIPALEGKLPVIVHANELRQIQAAVAFARREKLKLIILGGYDAPHCADLLKQREVPVIVSATHRLPQRAHDGYDDPFTVPERLRAAGVRFCISGEGQGSQGRNLPYHAATAAAYGLPPEEALKAITLYPAQIFGVGDRLGSLEPGKDATLIVTDGDPLEITTHVTAAFIQGRKIDLSNRHQRLWEKYQEKYRRNGEKPAAE